MIDRADLEQLVVSLRAEFAAAYETQRAASERAVLLMRRLDHAEALLDLFDIEPETPSARATSTSMEWDLPKRRREAPVEPGTEAPRRAVPRHGGMAVLA